MASLLTSSDVIETPGFGALPGVIGVVAAAGALTAVVLPALQAPHPSFVASLWSAAAAYLGYLAGVWVCALVMGVDPAAATSVVGRLAIGWWAPIVAAAAFVCAWAAVALRRTRAERPHWPWERDDEEP
ncbi:MAG: hypothetical protein QM611_11960 [Microbacterium sp.]|uniref:hypothetical protein n=1 Tax=Microbacterium sp. TaxID=51671 RepID=UPI0039E3FF7E